MVEPLEHCSHCNKRFTAEEVKHWRGEFGAGEDPDVDEDAVSVPIFVDEDFPDICYACAEMQEIDERLLAYAR